MKRMLSVLVLVLLSAAMFSACGGGGGGGGTSYTVGGSVSGLTGSGLVLQNNGADDLAVSADGAFTFATKVADGSAYLVTVGTQPSGQTCTASSNTGTVSGANVTNVSVVCSANAYTVGGSVSGLSGSGLVLQNNSSDDLAVSANGAFTFATKVADGAAYSVTVKTQPTGPNQTCTASSNSGTVSGANVTNVSVVCSTNAYTVGGSVSGLTGSGLVLQNNGADDLGISSNGAFAFTTPGANGSAYSVTIKTQPSTMPAQACVVSQGTGTISGSNVMNVAIACSVTALPKTGQSTSYAAGDDGALQKGAAWPDPRFIIASSGTGTVVTDNLTGLIWPQDGGTPPYSICTGGTTTWQGALDYVACLNTNNYLNLSGWRLPNKKEFRSLINYGQANFASWLNSQGFSNVHAGTYWVSTTSAGGAVAAWTVYYNGEMSNWLKTNSYYVWPVRDAGITPVVSLPKTGQTSSYAAGDDGDLRKGVDPPNPRFTPISAGTGTIIIDNLTGLIWPQDANTPTFTGSSSICTGGTTTWQGALDYVGCLNANSYLDHNDWRLPNNYELESLVDSSRSDPALPIGHPFANVHADYYWSSTTRAGISSEAWAVVLNMGFVVTGAKTDSHFVWPVRGGR